MTALTTLLTDLPVDGRVTDVYVGANWTLALVGLPDGTQRAGVASTPGRIAADSRFQVGHYALNEEAHVIARLLLSEDAAAAAVGLATINALNQPDAAALSTVDAADWLAAQSVNRSIAVVGRFPFIDDEIRPHARRVWVFEQEPHADEFDDTALPTVLPQADIVAITGSSVINHTLDLILPHVKAGGTIVLLGPSTPLSEKLFDSGIDAMFGVRVTSVPQVVESVVAGAGFQHMHGLQRVALFRRRA